MENETNCAMETHKLISRYEYLTTEVLPKMSISDKYNWPVSEDHCFKRIVLDSIFQGPWYESLPSPAYKYLNKAQAYQAVRLCEDIIARRVDIEKINQQSIQWRNKQYSFIF